MFNYGPVTLTYGQVVLMGVGCGLALVAAIAPALIIGWLGS